MSKASKSPLSVIPVTIPWTKSVWARSRIASITTDGKFLDFINGWARKIDSDTAIKVVERLSIDYIYDTLTAGGLRADKRALKATFNRSELLPETLEIMLEAVRMHCERESMEVSTAERVTLSLFIRDFTSFIMGAGKFSMPKAQRSRLKKALDHQAVVAIAYSIAAVNEHFDLTPKDEDRKAA